MTELPPVPPGLVAEAVEALPTRLRKKLDEVVARAAAWPVSTVDGAVTVSGSEITITTTVERRPVLLTVAGVSTISATGRASVRLVRG